MDQDESFKEQIVFEKMIYGDPPVFKFMEIQRKGFLVGLFGIYPRLRPQHLERFVIFCSNYLQDQNFRKIVLNEAFVQCPTLIHRLYRIQIFTKTEIKESLLFHRNRLLYWFFKNEIDVDDTGFSYSQSNRNQGNWSKTVLDSLIEYGFLPSSIEFCLKYDRLQEMNSIMMRNQNLTICKWSPFEWSAEPDSLDLLSFSGFFGSINCFKHLLLQGQPINQSVFSSIVCNGSLELFHLFNESNFFSSECVLNTSKFSRLSILVFKFENGADINAKDNYDWTSLHWASRNGHLSVVEYLVNQKADINAKDNGVEFLCLIILLFI